MGGGGLMHGIKILQQDFALKILGGGGGYAQWGVYLRNTMVILKIKDEKAVYNNLVNKHFNIQIDLDTFNLTLVR